MESEVATVTVQNLIKELKGQFSDGDTVAVRVGLATLSGLRMFEIKAVRMYDSDEVHILITEKEAEYILERVLDGTLKTADETSVRKPN